MNLGWAEIIFCMISFCFMWYFIFKIGLAVGKKRLLKNIIQKLEDMENKKFLIGGREAYFVRDKPKDKKKK